MSRIFSFVAIALWLGFSQLAVASAVGGDRGHYGISEGHYCSSVASKFQQDLRACWSRNQAGCIKYFTRKDVMSDTDFHSCKEDLYRSCVSTCYSVWGFNDSGCNNGCAIIGKYL